MPRPRETTAAAAGLAAAGAAFGAVLGGPFGAAVGGAIGGVAGGQAPLSLEQALQRKLSGYTLLLEGVRRASRFEIHVLCRDTQGRFWPITASIPPPSQPLSPDDLDDALYDAAERAIDEFQHAYLSA